ncbi:sulfate/molybdate ABC transporter ATP-binding protein [Microbacterium aquimaris]|uniref:ABC transporter ATP-binding protein n=1 Tax=Microbacterium aquimaris TaxID=459816 RepID=A0ABU5N9N1_9MICO|nr:ABC transporter ATP-binding protein [Microbacterium aquimaris]MDZ8162790.1 ABC transporter ATP-binding protein [Microbacterium aquimaris]
MTLARSGAALDAVVRVERSGGFVLDVSVEAAAGEVVAVLGPSGAGKSTLLGALAGLDRLDAGHVRVADRVVSAPHHHVPPARRGVALLGQDPLLFPHLSARENVAFALRAGGVPRADARRRADRWLDRVGLGGLGRRRPSEMSGGQQQRAALARALAADPAVVLLDEPLTGLDVETASEIRGVLRDQLRATGVTAILVTHSAVDAAALADRVVIVEDGAVTQRGPVAEVLRAPSTRFVAAVAGLNRVRGTVRGGVWTGADGVGPVLDAAAAPEGEAHAVFRPGAVRLVEARDGAAGRPTPSGATWAARIVRIEPVPFGAVVQTTAPDVAAEIGTDVLADRVVQVGRDVCLGVDGAQVRFVPAPPPRDTLSP